MKRAVVFVLAAAAGFPLRGAFEEKPFSARSAGLGEAMTAVFDGAETVAENPAGLRFTEARAVTSGHTRVLGMPGLDHRSLAAVWPRRARAAWGGFVSDFGSRLYREREVGLACAWGAGDRVGLGVALKGQSLSVRRYGTVSAVQADVGVAARPRPRLTAGVAVRNITQSPVGGETPPVLFAAGASTRLWGGGPLAVAVVQDSGGGSSWRVGQEIVLHPVLALRVGYGADPGRFSLGMGFRRSGLEIDYALVTHPALPDQHHVNLGYAWPVR